MKKWICLPLLFVYQILLAQNVGVGIIVPLQKLHIAAGASGNITPFGPLVVESNNNTYINIISPNINETSVLFGKASDASSGGIIYNNFNLLNGFQFRTNGNTTRMVIDQFGQVGIGVPVPGAKLDVAGNVRMSQLIIVSGGAVSDFLVKTDVDGTIGFRKGYMGLGINYMIALLGDYPSTSSPVVNNNYIGEIRLFTGNNPPFGWAFCNGQVLTVAGNTVLFGLIGTTYGGDGVNNFALPDLRDRVPVHPGTSWALGETSN